MKMKAISRARLALVSALVVTLLLIAASVFGLYPSTLIEAGDALPTPEGEAQAWLGPWGFWFRDWGGLMHGYTSVSYA